MTSPLPEPRLSDKRIEALAEEFNRRIEAIEADARRTALEQEAALIGQEHRLVRSVRNLGEVIFTRQGNERRRLLTPALTAFAWCLVPSGGTAAIGIVAILTLLVTFQQSRLLAIQNDKIEVQNLLAEAQRRASLVVEITAIFERIDTEKLGVGKATEKLCSDKIQRLCFRPSVPEEPQPIFVPSQATLGRIASLTQALRPYRYLTVEGAQPELCPQDTASPTLSAAYTALLGNIVGRGPAGARKGLQLETARALAAEAYRADLPFGGGAAEGLYAWLGSWIDRLAGGRFTNAAQLNCAPASPERGQLLVSLHAAGIDLSVIQASGGDFTYSDIPGAALAGVRLHGVNLTGSRLPNANFARAQLTKVIFRGADLTNARFSNSEIRNADFEGARIQVYNRDGDAPLFFMPRLSDDNLLSGLRLYQESAQPNIFGRVCGTLDLAQTVRSTSSGPTLADNAKDYGLLIETRGGPSGRHKQEAVVIFDLKINSHELHSSVTGATLEYRSFADCPPSPYK
jgi:hypothetical protein